MKGLELSERYYWEVCAPMLGKLFPSVASRIAAGLVGEGSECLGFDDEVSRDHDWGAAVCLWLSVCDEETYGPALRHELARLPASIYGYPPRTESTGGSGRTGVFSIGSFYSQFLGCEGVPETLAGWLALSESSLAVATSGAVFADVVGDFTRIRNGLLAFYPEDIRLKKLAARCAVMAQAGQYNLPRCVARKEYVAALAAEAAFVNAACSAVYLLNRRYMPFYKWMHRGLRDLPLLGKEMFASLAALVEAEGDTASVFRKKTDMIEDISAMLIRTLHQQGLSSADSDFLLDHGVALQRRVHDETIRRMNLFLG